MQDHTEGTSMHSQALETLQDRLREAETALRREQDSFRQMQVPLVSLFLFNIQQWRLDWTHELWYLQNEYSTRLSKVEADRQTLAESLAAAERRSGEEKLRFDDFQQQLKSAKAAAETAKQELQDYKHKASRILQVTSCVSLYLNKLNKYTKDGDCFFVFHQLLCSF